MSVLIHEVDSFPLLCTLQYLTGQSLQPHLQLRDVCVPEGLTGMENLLQVCVCPIDDIMLS